MFRMNNYTFKIIQSDLAIPSKLESRDGENIIMLNNISRPSKELLFDLYQCMAHVFIPAACVSISTKDASEWLDKHHIRVPDQQHLILEMACDQYAIDKIKYGAATPKNVLKDITMDMCRMMMPEFVLTLVGKLCKSMNESIEIRRQYLGHLFDINNAISKRESNKNVSPKKMAELDKFTQLASDFGYGESNKTPNVEIPILYDVCKELKCHPDKMDSFDKSMKRILNDVNWNKVPMSNEIQEFIESWVTPEYKRYRMMVSELERTPQRKLISNVLYEIVCKGKLPTDGLIETVRSNLIDDKSSRPNLLGFVSYNEKIGKK